MTRFLLLSLFAASGLAAQDAYDLGSLNLARPQKDGDVVHLRGRAVRWDREWKQPAWMALAGRKISGGRAHVVLQLAGPVDARGRQALESAGIRLLEPAPGDRAYYASLDLNAAAVRAWSSGQPMALMMTGVRAVHVPDEDDKLSPELASATLPRLASTDERDSEAELRVYFHADADLLAARTDLSLLGAKIDASNEFFQRMTVRLPAFALKRLAKLDWVQFVETPSAAPRLLTNRASAELILTNTLQMDPYSLTGRDMNIGIFEGLASAHREFGSRLTNVDRGFPNFHTTHVSGTLIAAGEFTPDVKGMAPDAKLFAHLITGDVPARMREQTSALGLFAVNNSWGYPVDDSLGNCNDFGQYRGDERDFDRVVRDRNVSVVFAIGNDRDEPICSNLARAGYYTVGRPASAKNVIAVGAVAAQGEVSLFSSAGPARDGRLKPDIVALGVAVRSTNGTTGTQVLQGTSMSAPAVTGTIALLGQRFKQRNDGANPDAALIKAILLNTARDLGNPGPDYTYGYGLVNAVDAIKTIDDKQFFTDRVPNGATKTHEIEVPAGVESLRVLLAYSDAPGVPGGPDAIVNHVDLAVTAPGGRAVLPLGLDPFDPAKNAAPRAGIRDTTKQVVIDKPAAGKYTIEVRGLAVTDGADQPYAVAWTTAPNPAPPCSATAVVSANLLTERGGLLTAHVNTGNQCDPWSITGAPDWIRPVDAGRRTGTSAIKLAVAENPQGGPRTAAFRIAGQRVEVTQNSACVTESIAFGQTVDGEFSSTDCYLGLNDQAHVRRYEFEGRQGQSILITMDSDVLDSYVILAGQGNTLLTFDDDGGGGLNSRVPTFGGGFQLPYTGRYTIWATTIDEREVGPFRLTLSEGPTVEGGPATPRQITGCPASVTGGLTASSSRAGRRGDLFRTEIYQFPGRAGQELTIELTNAAFDPFVYLLGPGGGLLGTATNDGSGVVRLQARLTQNGVHQIEVSSFAPFVTGSFTLGVQGCSAP